MVSPLQTISPITKIQGADAAEKPAQESGALGSFGSVFQSAIDNVINAEAEKNQLQYQLAVGELDNPALLTIASTKYQIAVDLMVQLRNKALEAYSELTRINL